MMRVFRRPISAGVLAATAACLAGGWVISQVIVAPPPAFAQNALDAGAQNREIIEQLKQSNQRLTEIAVLLREIRDQKAPPKEDGKVAPPTKK